MSDFMHLTEILRPEMVWPHLKANTKPEVIRELARFMAANDKALDEKSIGEVLMERERLGSTGIRDGIAIPHGKVPGLDRMIIACGRSESGIDFDAHDKKPTHLFFVLLAPEFAAGQHLKALARLSKLLNDAGFREKLMSSKNAEEIFCNIVEEDKNN
ncbi:MAG: PTS sugar transporter subunit IIA [Pseudomonadota bacterium]